MTHMNSVAEFGVRDDANLSILKSLGLLRYVVIRFSIPQRGGDGFYELSAHYHHLTQLSAGMTRRKRGRADWRSVICRFATVEDGGDFGPEIR